MPSMEQPTLEHANLTVGDLDATVRFVTTAFPSFTVRGEGLKDDGERRWLHLGTASTYVALEEGRAAGSGRTLYGTTPGLNHLGWVVDDLDALCARMAAAGFVPNLTADEHPARRRRYFHDPDGNDWEFVEYRSDDVAERNDYSR